MRPALVLALALFLNAASPMAAGISPREYQERRAELRKSLDGVMVLFGAEEPDDLHTSFFQESNFLYLSGWREPGAVMLLTQQAEILFSPHAICAWSCTPAASSIRAIPTRRSKRDSKG